MIRALLTTTAIGATALGAWLVSPTLPTSPLGVPAVATVQVAPQVQPPVVAAAAAAPATWECVPATAEPPAPAAAAAPSASTNAGLVNLNTATVDQLDALPAVRITHDVAERIVAARPFTSVAQLDDVSGIGPATMGRVASPQHMLVTV